LGPFPALGAAEARERAQDLRKAVRLGGDPFTDRAAARKEAVTEAAAAITFGEMAEARIAAWGGLRPKTLRVYASFLRNHAIPALGERALLDITADDVKAVVEPILKRTYQTGRRVRWHIEDVFEYAKEAGVNQFPAERANPAAWNRMKRTLKSVKQPHVKHHAAMPWAEVPSFMNRLRANGSRRALALMLVILSGLRSQEVRLAKWSHIDLAKGEWRVPREIMKEGVAHIVPLSAGAKIILAQLRQYHQGGDLLFPAQGKRFTKAMSESSMLSLINGDPERGGWGLGLTVHGFRSSIRDWGAENGHSNDAMEWVIAHGVPNDKTVAAYKRTTLFVQRVEIMEAWSRHVMPRHLAAVA
jgi:integrase